MRSCMTKSFVNEKKPHRYVTQDTFKDIFGARTLPLLLPNLHCLDIKWVAIIRNSMTAPDKGLPIRGSHHLHSLNWKSSPPPSGNGLRHRLRWKGTFTECRGAKPVKHPTNAGHRWGDLDWNLISLTSLDLHGPFLGSLSKGFIMRIHSD